MHHTMSPTGVAVLLLLALVVDWMSVGPNSIRDRIAFLMGLAAIHEGFSGSPLAHWTVGALSTGIDTLKHMAGTAYIAGAATQAIVGAAVGILAIYTVGALLPTKASGKLGRFATIAFPQSGLHRLNYKLWLCAALLGMLADLPHGIIGQLLNQAIGGLTSITASIPYTLFGVS